ncbi:MAG TPA: UDP-3-O-(3-hydroxymyristoyl)glucosamine N-acyltransferase [Blastocatellia bacterium]|nr:UDP-3-O-(3-hydroxymyristoyl)glucosamine N-acyltransferase [Blastocatellia bacterium]
MKLSEIAQRLKCQVLGDPEIEITGLAPIEIAQAHQLTFLSNRKYRRYLSTTAAAAIITDEAGNLLEGQSGLLSDNPYLTFAEALSLFYTPPRLAEGIHPQASISPTAIIGAGVSIGPFTVIGDGARIGDRTVILSHCTIYPEAEIGTQTMIHSHCVVRERCRVGSHVVLQNNVVIGSDGFGYARRHDRTWYKIPQTGLVVIEDEVEIGPGSVIDRATIGVTRVGRGTKIDNLVQIGHGSSVGRNTLLCAQVGLAGSTSVGDEVILSGQVGVAGHLSIGDRVVATAQTGIPNSVEPDRVVSGYPAIDNRNWLRSSAIFAQLPQLYKELKALRERLAQLETESKSKPA